MIVPYYRRIPRVWVVTQAPQTGHGGHDHDRCTGHAWEAKSASWRQPSSPKADTRPGSSVHTRRGPGWEEGGRVGRWEGGEEGGNGLESTIRRC